MKRCLVSARVHTPGEDGSLYGGCRPGQASLEQSLTAGWVPHRRGKRAPLLCSLKYHHLIGKCYSSRPRRPIATHSTSQASYAITISGRVDSPLLCQPGSAELPVGTKKRSYKVKKARFLCENGQSGDAQLPDRGRSPRLSHEDQRLGRFPSREAKRIPRMRSWASTGF